MTSHYARYWWYQLGGWGSFAVFNIIFISISGQLSVKDMNRVLIFVGLGISFTHGMRWVIQHIKLLQKSFNKQLVGLAILTFAVTIIMAAVKILMFQLLNLEIPIFVRSGLFLGFLSSTVNIFIYISIWNFIYLIYHCIGKARKQQLAASSLQSLVMELESKSKTEHIRPHLIFDSLNSIQSSIIENPEKARKSITELSSVLRSCLQREKLIRKSRDFYSGDSFANKEF